MENIMAVLQFFQAHGGDLAVAFVAVMVAIGGFLKAVEALLQLVAPFTPWKWDDNLATMLGKWAALKVFNKK